jgi:hypothetical protein
MVTPKEIHNLAKEKGWWEEDRELSDVLLLVVCEIAEAYEEFRNHKAPTEIYYGEDGKPEGIPIEIGDAVIRIFDLCEHFGINIEEAIRIKHEYNKTRPYRHGGKKA